MIVSAATNTVVAAFAFYCFVIDFFKHIHGWMEGWVNGWREGEREGGIILACVGTTVMSIQTGPSSFQSE